MNIWQFQDRVSTRLLWWAGASLVFGLALIVWGRGFWRGFGIQAAAWGTIDAAIALVGRVAASRRRAALPEPDLPAILAREGRNLRRLLWVNTGLDVLYVSGGVALALTLGADSPFWLGNGWSIVVQGGFLFLFDLFHALGVPMPKEGP